MSDDALFAAFWSSLALTVVILVAAIVLAKMHRVTSHIGAVAAFVASLLVTLVFAERLGQRFDFDATPRTIHLSFAFTTAGALLAPLVTGFRRWRGTGSLAAHKLCVGVFLVLVGCAVSTGVWMFSTRHPPEPRASSAGTGSGEGRPG
jgi:hypothetical protein